MCRFLTRRGSGKPFRDVRDAAKDTSLLAAENRQRERGGLSRVEQPGSQPSHSEGFSESGRSPEHGICFGTTWDPSVGVFSLRKALWHPKPKAPLELGPLSRCTRRQHPRGQRGLKGEESEEHPPQNTDILRKACSDNARAHSEDSEILQNGAHGCGLEDVENLSHVSARNLPISESLTAQKQQNVLRPPPLTFSHISRSMDSRATMLYVLPYVAMLGPFLPARWPLRLHLSAGSSRTEQGGTCRKHDI